jgi:hypothetical protein
MSTILFIVLALFCHNVNDKQELTLFVSINRYISLFVLFTFIRFKSKYPGVESPELYLHK